jgi:hypothetical protein
MPFPGRVALDARRWYVDEVNVKTACVVFLMFAVTASAQTNHLSFCCRYPIRGFGLQTVNLAPLFQWWNHPGADGADDSKRPMKAWKRVVGVKVSDFGYGWVVEAEVYRDPATHTKTRIVLQNPPALEASKYETTKDQIVQSGLDITNAQARYQTARKAEQDDQNRAKAARRSRYWAAQYNQQAADDRAAATLAQDDEKAAKQTLELARLGLKILPDLHGQYQIDWFAMDTGKTLQGLPIYDAGAIGSASP